MPNALTGEFDIVVQVSNQAVNRILAAQHQVQRSERPQQIYLHSFWTRIPPGGGTDDTGVRGSAQVQVSTPTVSFPPGGGSRLTVRFDVRGHVSAQRPLRATVTGPIIPREPGLPPADTEVRFEHPVNLPEFIHGEVRITTDIGSIGAPGEDMLPIDLSAADVEIEFTPAAGSPPILEPARSLLERSLENYVRTGFEPSSVPLRLPDRGVSSVRHFRFKAIDSRTLALILNLRDVAIDSGLASYMRGFLGAADDFAIAVGRDYLVQELQRVIRDELTRVSRLRHPTVSTPFGSCAYTIGFREPSVAFVAGRFSIQISGWATTPDWCPNYDFTIGLEVTLRVEGNRIRVEIPGDPAVNVRGLFGGAVEDGVREAVRNARDEFVRQAQPMIDDMLRAFSDILGQQALYVPSPRITYTAVEIEPDGVVVRGRLGFGPWREPVVAFQGTFLGRSDEGLRWEINALESWIPGGTVHEYQFWWRGREIRRLPSFYPDGTPVPEPDSGITIYEGGGPAFEAHRFVARFVRPAADPVTLGSNVAQPIELCVAIYGTQASDSGAPRPVSADSCGIFRPPTIPGLSLAAALGLSEAARRLRFPVAVTAGGRVMAHISLWDEDESPRAAAADGGANLVVHFPAPGLDSLPSLWEAVGKGMTEKVAATVIAVLPPGALQKAISQAAGARLTWAEDFEGSWAQAFNVQETPATFVFNTEGKLAWRQTGKLDRKALVAVFKEKFSQRQGTLRWRRLGLGVREGEPAPDFLFDYMEGKRMAFRRLRGRRVVLSFWTSWSAPCLEELHRLQHVHCKPAPEDVVVLAVNDGEDPKLAREVCQRNKFGFRCVTDPQRQISRLYRVSCWPATLSINEVGVVESIRLGLASSEESFEAETGQGPEPQPGHQQPAHHHR